MNRLLPQSRSRVVAAWAVLAAACTSAPAQVRWRELGPAPIRGALYTGRVSAVACSRTDPNRCLIGGADGGVWRTVDGGATWTPLTDHMPTTAVGAIAIDPQDENVVYVGTGEANYANHSRYGLGLYKSTDGGDTWTQLAQDVFGGRTISRIIIHPQNTQIVYAAVARAGGFPELAAAKRHPGATGPVGVFRSLDGGSTWTQLAGGLPALAATDLDIDPANPAVLYAAIGHVFGNPANGVYKTTNGGDSWTRLAGGLPTGTLGRIALAVAPSNPQRVYVLVVNPSDSAGGGASTRGGFRTDNGGTTWTSMPVGSFQATYGWYLCVVAVHPTNPDIAVMGGLSLIRTTNGGTSWTDITPPHVDLHAAAWDAAGRLIVGDDGGVHRSTDNGNSWSSINGQIGAIQFYAGLSTHPTDDLIIFGGTQDNGSNRRNTNTKGWDQVYGGDGGWTQVDQVNPSRVFVEYQGTGNLFRSTNGGNSFSFAGSGISGRNCFLPAYVIDPTDSNRMLYGTERVFRSTNGGTSWSALSGDLTNGAGAIRTLALAPSNPQVVYAATNDGNVAVSTDGGQSFQRVLSGVPGWPRVTREIFVDPTDPLTAYLAVAAFGESQLRRTRDAGRTWQPLDAALPDVPVNTVAADVRGNLPTIFAGADDGLYRSVDDGASWHRYGAGLPNGAVIDLLLQPQRGRLIAGTQGRGAWLVPVMLAGDMNGDGAVSAEDIQPFIWALFDPQQYADNFPDIDPLLPGDLNGDGLLNAGDIEAFIAVLFG